MPLAQTLREPAQSSRPCVSHVPESVQHWEVILHPPSSRTPFPSGWGEGCIADVIFLLIMGRDWRLVFLTDKTLKARPVVT